MKKFCIANVVPLVRLPNDKLFFNYLVGDGLEVKVGQLVIINFRRKKIIGLVCELSFVDVLPKFKLNEILKLVNERIFLSEKNIQDAILFSKLYKVSLSAVCKMMLPTLQPRMLGKVEFGKIQEKTIPKKQNKLIVLNNKTKIEKLSSLISDKKQILFLVPTKLDVEFWLNKLNFKNIKKYTSDSSVVEQRNIWTDLKSNKKICVLSTRQGCFLPFENLDLIVVWNPQDEHHKNWDMQPYYNVVDIIEQRWKGELIYCTHSINTNFTFDLQNKNLKLLNPLLDAENKIKTIDLQNEIRKKNFGFISDEVQEIFKNKKPDDKILFLHNRKGFSKIISCADCDFVLLNQETSCPKCSNSKFKFLAKGIKGIASDLLKRFPKLKITTLSSETDLPDLNNFDCVFATDTILYRLDLNQFAKIIIPYADKMISMPWFSTTEDSYYLLKTLQWQAPEAEIIVQTFSPKNMLWRAVNFVEILKKFISFELKTRAQFNLPPYVIFVRLICEEKDFTNDKEISHPKILNLTKELPIHDKNGTKYMSYLCSLNKETWKQDLAQILQDLNKNWRSDPRPLP